MAQRLALHHILQNQIKEYNTCNVAADVELQKITKKEMEIMKSVEKSKNVNSTYFEKKPDVKSIFDNFVSTVHNTMKSSSPPLKSVPTVPAAVAEIADAPTKRPSKRRRIKGGQHARVANAGSKKFTIPSIKALMGENKRMMMRRGIADINTKNFNQQRSIRDMLQQKSVLQQMLQQHKRLQHDRTKIAIDLQRMRQELNRIHNKLETSWQSLHNTHTIYGSMQARKASPAKRRSSSVVRQRDHTKGNAPHGRGIASHSRGISSVGKSATQRQPSRPPNQLGGHTMRRPLPATSKKRRVRKAY